MWNCFVISAARWSTGSIVFVIVTKFFLFLCKHNNSWTTAIGLMKFCMYMYLTTSRTDCGFKAIGQTSRSRFFCVFCLHHDTRGQYLALQVFFACLKTLYCYIHTLGWHICLIFYSVHVVCLWGWDWGWENDAEELLWTTRGQESDHFTLFSSWVWPRWKVE